MFARIRTAKHLKVKATCYQIEVGFFGWVTRVTREHHFGKRERISKEGLASDYPERPLIGLSESNRNLMINILLRHMDPIK